MYNQTSNPSFAMVAMPDPNKAGELIDSKIFGSTASTFSISFKAYTNTESMKISSSAGNITVLNILNLSLWNI